MKIELQLPPLFTFLTVLCAPAICTTGAGSPDQAKRPAPVYHIYSGNTHSHSVYTWSHGSQYVKAAQEDGDKKVPGVYVSPEGVQFPAKARVLQADWQKQQEIHTGIFRINH